MPTYQLCPKAVEDMAAAILRKYETHKPLLECKPKIDFMFAYPTEDEQGVKSGPAISKDGYPCLGLTRKIGLKDRAAGRGDAEILLDGDWWRDASESEQVALLDHELTHLEPKIDKRGLKRDDLGRPILQLRLHDVQHGWFKCIAARHGVASQERQQAHAVMCDMGQYFWPEMMNIVADKTLEGVQQTQANVVPGRFDHIAKDVSKKAKAEKA